MSSRSNLPPLSKTLPPLLKEGMIVFCGAGISIPPPSCSPSWWKLTEEILKTFFDRIPEDYNLPKDMILKDSDRQPEEVFETFSNILDERLFKAFEALDVAKPNPIHYILARLAKAGILKACFTTNFDIYLEHALKEEKVDFELLVDNIEYQHYFEKNIKNNFSKNKFVLCKIHGTIERPNTIVSVASAYKSAKGFSAPKAEFFQYLLEKYPCIFLGYSGWDFNHLNYLLEKQVKVTANSKSNKEFEEQAGAVSITIMQMAAYLHSTYSESKVYKDLLLALSQKNLPQHQRDPNINITKEMLDEMDASIRKKFIPIIERAEKSNPRVNLLMESALLAIWLIGTQYLDPIGMQEYQRMWDAGEYPKRFAPKEIYEYLLQKIKLWLDNALDTLPARYNQKLCGNLAIMGEMGEDFELCKIATLKSLELSEGVITEATPENIPGNLAAFYERRGDKDNALKYYQLCLDAIKLRVPPVWTDAIINRSAVLLNEKGEKRKALEIIGLYHPSFRGNASVLNLPAKKKAEELAEKISRELGYNDAHSAVDILLG
jgi:hypothetical protein